MQGYDLMRLVFAHKRDRVEGNVTATLREVREERAREIIRGWSPCPTP